MSIQAGTQAGGAKPFGFRFIVPLALGSCLNPINSTMIATALVPLATAFHASVAQTGWLIAALYLCCAVAQPTLGRVADLVGARRVYIVSLVLVMIAGFAGRVAPSLGWLVGVRVLLGIGTSGAYPSAMRLFRERADATGSPPPRTAMGVLSLMGVATAAVGPVLGGVLTGAFGWHAIFTVNIPLALLTLVLVLAWVPADPPRRERRSLWRELDLPGIVLFSGALLALMVFLLDVDHPRWLALPIAAVLGGVLAWHSLRRSNPFIDLRMLANHVPLSVTYLRAALAFTFVYCIFYGFAQWVESAGGYSAAQAGLATVPLSVLAGASSILGARTRGLRGPFLLGFGCAIVGCVAVAFIDASSPLWVMAAAVALFGVPQGLVSVTTQAAVFVQAPAEQMGAASGLQRTATYIGAIAATAVIGVSYGHRPTDHGLHMLAYVMAGLAVLLFVATLFDRTLPRAENLSQPHP
ncbi:MFS transporter [Bacillus sp. NP157]|nr:MFS transporter [Bacillus sp. NP157]